MRAHRLAKWLLDREDAEVYVMKEDRDPTLKDLKVDRPWFVNGIAKGVADGEDNRVFLFFRGERTKEEQKQHLEKTQQLYKSDPDRLLSSDQSFNTEKEKAEAIIKEAKEKGYTILPADDPKRKQYGVVVYKEIDGVELAYNPSWPEEEGEIDRLYGVNVISGGYNDQA